MSNAPGPEYASIDVTTFGDAGDKFIAGLQQVGEFTIAGPFDDAAGGPDKTLGTLVGGSGTGTFYPIGTASTNRKLTFDFICLSYRVNGAVKERMSYESRFVVNGTITVGTV